MQVDDDNPGGPRRAATKRDAMLRDFLQSRRARLRPDEVGVPPGPGPRRVPGLRREEVAHLAGISVDYYVRFEQGRCRNVSDALLDSVARVLRLTPSEHQYLYLVTRTPAARVPAASDSTDLSTGLRLLVENLSGPAFVLCRRFDLLAINDAATALLRGLDAHGNYLRWLMLDPASRSLCADWSVMAHEATAMLRFTAARHPADPGVSALVDELTEASPEFRRIWARHEVDSHRNGPRRFQHPVVGEVVFHSERLVVPDEPDHVLITYSLEPGGCGEVVVGAHRTDLVA